MASCNFEKMKTPQDVKAKLRHCDSEMRKQDEHQNWHIDKDMTSENMQITDRDYKTVCNLYDDKIKELDSKVGANKRKDRVTAVGIDIPCPKDLSSDKESEWLIKANNIVASKYGASNILQCYMHFDEKHNYINAETKEECTSRSHLHVYLIPQIDGKLNAKAFTARSNMIDLNNKMQDMTERDYGITFMDGTKKKSKKSVEALKQESNVIAFKMDLEAQYQAKVNKLALDKEKWLKTQNTAFESLKADLEEQAKKNYEAQVKRLEKWASDYKNKLDEEFQQKEDALEAQFKVQVDEAAKRRLAAASTYETSSKSTRRLPGEPQL